MMTARAKIIWAAAAMAASTALSGCVSAPAEAPAWFADQAGAQTRGYPSLHDVPRTAIANTNAAHWAAVQAEVTGAAAAMRANPRAEPAGPMNPEQFVADARQELEDTRESHEQ